MRGRSIPGRQAARDGGRSASLAAVLLAGMALAGCAPDPSERRQQAGDETGAIPFPTTSEQVNRSRKTARLIRPAGELSPDGKARRLVNLPQADRSADAGPERAPRPDHGSRIALSGFYGALEELAAGTRRKPVTVLHLGDSHIASDRFTGDLRGLLQARFGDAGRGLMMPGFPFPYYRARGVRFSKGPGWKTASSLARAPGPYGLTGVRLSSRSKDAWLRLDSVDGAFEWAEVTFLAGPGHGTARVSADGARKTVVTRADREEARTVRLQYKGSRLEVRGAGDGPVTLLSWAVGHERPGVRYVNLGIPSATADITRRWDDDLIAVDLKRLAPDLVILGYGTNEGFNDGLDIAAYEGRVAVLLGRLQDRAPQASFLVIGPPDSARYPRFARKGRKYAALRDADCRALTGKERRGYRKLVKARSNRLARWHAPPKLGAVRQALKRAAGRADAHFWDWSEVMGGPCGVHDWATAAPALAMSDHVHITAEGSRRTAQALYDELMAGYEAYRKLAGPVGAGGPASGLVRPEGPATRGAPSRGGERAPAPVQSASRS